MLLATPKKSCKKKVERPSNQMPAAVVRDSDGPRNVRTPSSHFAICILLLFHIMDSEVFVSAHTAVQCIPMQNCSWASAHISHLGVRSVLCQSFRTLRMCMCQPFAALGDSLLGVLPLEARASVENVGWQLGRLVRTGQRQVQGLAQGVQRLVDPAAASGNRSA